MAITESIFRSAEAAETERRRKEASRDLGDMVDRMVDARRTEPDVELALAICASVNQRGAASSAIWDVTGRIAQTLRTAPPASCLLALFLADVLAIHCGFPAHLAVTRRDFLNALVRRFPSSGGETDPVHAAVLRLLAKWRATLCASDSPHAGDFALVREACTLLTSRKFCIPAPDADDVAAMRASGLVPPLLRTKEEILRDESVVQEAKLQLLLRRGRPEDLRTANRLMCILAAHGASSDPAAVTKADRTIEADLQAVEAMRTRLCDLMTGGDACRNGVLESKEASNLQEDMRAALPRLHRLAATSDLHPTTLEHTIALYTSVRETLEASGMTPLEISTCTEAGTGFSGPLGESHNLSVQTNTYKGAGTGEPRQGKGNLSESVTNALALINLEDDGLSSQGEVHKGDTMNAASSVPSSESLLDGPSESSPARDPFDELVSSMISGAKNERCVKAAWSGRGVLVQVVSDGRSSWTLVVNMSLPESISVHGSSVAAGTAALLTDTLFPLDAAEISVSLEASGAALSLSRH